MIHFSTHTTKKYSNQDVSFLITLSKLDPIDEGSKNSSKVTVVFRRYNDSCEIRVGSVRIFIVGSVSVI